nr:non-structural protein NS2a [Apoi virus]
FDEEPVWKPWGIMGLIVLLYMGFFPSLGNGKFSMGFGMAVFLLCVTGMLSLTELAKYTMLLMAVYAERFDEPCLWAMTVSTVFDLRPGAILLLVFTWPWHFQRVVAAASVTNVLSLMITEGVWAILDGVGLVLYCYLLTRSGKKSMWGLLFVSASRLITEGSLQVAWILVGALTMLCSSRHFLEGDWVQKAGYLCAGYHQVVSSPWRVIPMLWNEMASRKRSGQR